MVFSSAGRTDREMADLAVDTQSSMPHGGNIILTYFLAAQNPWKNKIEHSMFVKKNGRKADNGSVTQL